MEYLKTFREMFTRPENVIDTFVLKEKSKFQHPFIFGVMGIVIIMLLNFIFVDFNTGLQTSFVDSNSDQISQLNYWIEYAKLKVSTQFLPLTMFFLLVPSLTLPGIFFFRNEIDGFYYNLILNSYTIGTSVFALLVLIPIWIQDQTTLSDTGLRSYLPLIFTSLLALFIYRKYFTIDDLRGWMRIISSFTMGCFIFLMLKSFSAGIIGYFIFAVNRFLDIWVTV